MPWAWEAPGTGICSIQAFGNAELARDPPADTIPLPCIPTAAGTWGRGAGRAQDLPAAGEHGGTECNERRMAKS